MSRWTNVRSDNTPTKRTRERKSDYLEGPFPWTRQQAVACFEAHGWGGGECLLIAMRNAWVDPRPRAIPLTR